MRKCLFFDFDNTLYSHKTKRVPESAKKALSDLRAQGHYIVLATGRGLESQDFIRQESGFDFDAMILLNGQQVFIGDKLVFEHHETIAESGLLSQLTTKYDIPLGGWTEHGVMVNRIDSRVAKVISDFTNFNPLEDSTFPVGFSIYMVHLYAKQNEEPLFQEVFKDFIFNRSHDYLLNLIPKSAGKSTGISMILDQTRIPKADSIAFGDGYNDVDMLENVGTSIAMENGAENLKSIATFIADTPDNNGIAKMLRQLDLI